MCYFDMWVYPAIMAMASWIGFIENASQVIIFNITSAVYAVAIGFGSASCFFVGKNIGKRRVKEAIIYSRTAYIWMQTINLVFSIAFILAPETVLRFYTSNNDII